MQLYQNIKNLLKLELNKFTKNYPTFYSYGFNYF